MSNVAVVGCSRPLEEIQDVGAAFSWTWDAFDSESRYSTASPARHDLNLEVPYIKYI